MKTSQWLLAYAHVAAAAVIARSGPQALYYLDNEAAGATIVSLKIGQDGTLSDPVRTPTGGKGMFGLTATGLGGGGETSSVQPSLKPLALLGLSNDGGMVGLPCDLPH
jgi:hypothetical protein